MNDKPLTVEQLAEQLVQQFLDNHAFAVIGTAPHAGESPTDTIMELAHLISTALRAIEAATEQRVLVEMLKGGLGMKKKFEYPIDVQKDEKSLWNNAIESVLSAFNNTIERRRAGGTL